MAIAMEFCNLSALFLAKTAKAKRVATSCGDFTL